MDVTPSETLPSVTLAAFLLVRWSALVTSFAYFERYLDVTCCIQVLRALPKCIGVAFFFPRLANHVNQ